MTKIIYAYVKKDTQEYKYIGQTNNLEVRIKKHNDYDPYNPQLKEYNYPLSRAIRKYGKEAFDIIILEENLTQEEADIREQYWIEYYNTCHAGYNQTYGGSTWGYSKFSYEIIQKAKQLIKSGMPFNQISQLTGISVVHLSQLNNGTRHHDSNETYPLWEKTQGAKLAKKDVQEITELLKNSNLTKAAIARQYGVKIGVINNLNVGRTYKQDNIQYPIRK